VEARKGLTKSRSGTLFSEQWSDGAVPGCQPTNQFLSILLPAIPMDSLK
jgi:hypothetical protein